MSIAKDSPELRNAFIDNYNNYAQGLDSKDWDLVRWPMLGYAAVSALGLVLMEVSTLVEAMQETVNLLLLLK